MIDDKLIQYKGNYLNMEMPEYLIKAVMEIANAKYHKRYSMASEQHYSEGDTRILCESFLALAEAMLKDKK